MENNALDESFAQILKQTSVGLLRNLLTRMLTRSTSDAMSIRKKNVKAFQICTFFLKIKKSDLKNSKHFKFLYPIRFQYKEFNEIEKLKFENHLIYFLS
jgi:hypothetical protein